MKKCVLWAAVLALGLTAGSARAIDYDAEKFQNLEKMADKLVKADIKNLQKFNVKKVAIVECTGGFIQSKEVTASAFEQRWTDWDSTKIVSTKTTLTIDTDYYTLATDLVCEMARKIFTQNGIEVVAKEAVANNPIYQDFEFPEEKKTRGATSGVFASTVVKTGIKRSTSGLGLFPGGLKLIKVEKNLPHLTHQLGADAAVRILFDIDKGKKGEPILTGFKVCINAGVNVQGKNVYFKRTSNPKIPNLNLKEAIASKADISGETKNSINMEKYHRALIEVADAAINMYTLKVHELFPESQPVPEPAAEEVKAAEPEGQPVEGEKPAEEPAPAAGSEAAE